MSEIPEQLSTHEERYMIEHMGRLLMAIAAETTKELNERQEQLDQCTWTDGELNPDTDFSKLSCALAEECWLRIRNQHGLVQVDMKATIPDINCVFTIHGNPIQARKIELKSSKQQVMPGSTIGKLDINQPLIYCYRSKNADKPYDIRYGQYHAAMGESNIDLFQDRTPRPKINFLHLCPPHTEIDYTDKKKDAWITHYGKCAVNRLYEPVSSSWQDKLTKSIVYEALKNVKTMEDVNRLLELVALL